MRVISLFLTGVGMNERRQRATVDDQPRDEGSKLLWSEKINLEHANGMWAKWSVPNFVDAELRDCDMLMLLQW